jgi:hypothetical protein
MSHISIVPILLALLLSIGATPGFTQNSGDGLAEQLNTVRQQRRQLEQDIVQYETSIDLLRSSSREQSTVSPAITALDSQLRKSHKQLLQLINQEADILDILPREKNSNPAAAGSNRHTLDATEVARLKTLLRNYQSQLKTAEAAETAVNSAANAQQSPLSPTSQDSAYAAFRVKLNGAEGAALTGAMNRRLEDASAPVQRRQVDMIFHIEIRRDSKLTSSRSYNLKALSKYEYFSKVSLLSGTAVISVRNDTWVAELTSQDANDYVITLSLLPGEKPELHVIPVDELKSTQWTEPPPSWLSDLGIEASTPAS